MTQYNVKKGNVITGSFKITPELGKKRLLVVLVGFLTADQSQVYVSEYMMAKSKVNLKTTTLVVDCTEIAPFQPEFLEPLGGLFQDYASFYRVFIVKPKKYISLSQLERVVKRNGLEDKIKFVERIAECE